MQQTTVKLHSYGYDELRTYLWAAAFVAGNIILPQLFHLLPKGGMVWLPIYFFTLTGAYKCGWRVGLLTAIASPLVNSACFGMPMPAVLPAILCKSVLLALAASYAASHFKTVTMGLLIGVVAFYQATGTMCEWAMTGSLTMALQDVRLGLPGMALQVVGGYLVIKHLLNGKQ